MSWNLVGSLTLQIPSVLWLPRQHETIYFWSLRYIVYHEQGQQSVATNSTGKDDLKLQQKLCDAQWIVFITVPFKKIGPGGGRNHSKEKGGRHDFSCIHILKPESLYNYLNKHLTSGRVCGCVHSHTECSVCLATSIRTCVHASVFVCIQNIKHPDALSHKRISASGRIFCSRTFGGNSGGDCSPASQRTRNHKLKPWEQSHYTNNYQTIPTTSLAAAANQSPQKQLMWWNLRGQLQPSKPRCNLVCIPLQRCLFMAQPHLEVVNWQVKLFGDSSRCSNGNTTSPPLILLTVCLWPQTRRATAAGMRTLVYMLAQWFIVIRCVHNIHNM